MPVTELVATPAGEAYGLFKLVVLGLMTPDEARRLISITPKQRQELLTVFEWRGLQAIEYRAEILEHFEAHMRRHLGTRERGAIERQAARAQERYQRLRYGQGGNANGNGNHQASSAVTGADHGAPADDCPTESHNCGAHRHA